MVQKTRLDKAREESSLGRVRVEPDSWLARVFGYGVFKVSFTDQDSEQSTDLLVTECADGLRLGHPAFLYAKVPTSRVDQVRALVRSGFDVVDVNMTLSCKPKPQGPGTFENRISVRESSESDREAILSIAFSCFRYSRFHLDPAIPIGLSNSIKRAWIESYFEKTRGEKLLTAELDGNVAGFVALLGRDSGAGLERVIDLIGVSNTYQRRGVGRRLLMQAVEDSVHSAVLVKAGTQAANIPSIRLYERCGFCMTESAYVLHAHVPN